MSRCIQMGDWGSGPGLGTAGALLLRFDEQQNIEQSRDRPIAAPRMGPSMVSRMGPLMASVLIRLMMMHCPQELELRPVIISNIKSDVDLKTKTANAWVDTKPWINDTEREEVVAALEALLKLVTEKEAEQAKKLDHETPAFMVAELAAPVDKVWTWVWTLNAMSYQAGTWG